MGSVSALFDKIFNVLSSFAFIDFFDILLVTFIIYEGIKLIRDSRSLQLIKGMVLLVLSFAFVKLFNMEASSFLFTKLFENAFLIIVILFSPEIRNILESFGRRSLHNISFLPFKTDSEYTKTVTDTVNDWCTAAGEMSESKTGALVVFERSITLKEYYDSGEILDAVSSVRLFNGLFFKNSALHDGAVIVRDGKIYAAACILPLTSSQDVSDELGTRHRAAIGVTENTDAIAVVVSEETGCISVIINGKIMRDISTGKLREILLDNLVSKKSGTKNRFFAKKKNDDDSMTGGENDGSK